MGLYKWNISYTTLYSNLLYPVLQFSASSQTDALTRFVKQTQKQEWWQTYRHMPL